LIKQALDAGAWGIVAPMIDTVQQAEAVIAAAKYPPLGNRSLGGGLHALNFAASTMEYFHRANDEILVVLQTESQTGVDNAEQIYSLPGIDAIFVGPVDLRANMRGSDGNGVSDADFEAVLQRIVAAGQKAGTPTGMHVMNAQTASQRVADGMQFLAVSSDVRMMTQNAQDLLQSLQPEAASKEITSY
jgi:4-hydroxy-2-oxoheptanedioate aldolase